MILNTVGTVLSVLRYIEVGMVGVVIFGFTIAPSYSDSRAEKLAALNNYSQQRTSYNRPNNSSYSFNATNINHSNKKNGGKGCATAVVVIIILMAILPTIIGFVSSKIISSKYDDYNYDYDYDDTYGRVFRWGIGALEILVTCFLFTFLGNEIVFFFLEGVIFRLSEPAVLLVIGTEIMRVQVI